MRRRHVIAIMAVLSILLLGASVWNTQETLDRATLKGIIYDQLIDVPSAMDFDDEARNICEGRMKLDYLSEDEVDINTLKLGLGSSALAVFRVHSGVFDNRTWLFTGEGYSESGHVIDQVRGLVHIARCSSTSELVFAVGPQFIHDYWGNLDGCLVILMGCESLDDTVLAEMMVESGASAVVGWRGPVSIDESDMVSLRLLEALISGSSVGEGVEQVDVEFGLEGRLVFYPVEAYGFRWRT